MSRPVTTRVLYSTIRRAAGVAAEWYASLADAHPADAAEHAEYRALSHEIAQIPGMSAARMGRLGADVVFAALVGAEEWETTYSEANAKADPRVAKWAREAAARYREVRLATLGRSRFEADLEESSPVDLEALRRR